MLAIELLTAARGIELRAPLEPAPATAAVIAALREHAPGPGADRFLAPEIEAAARSSAAAPPPRGRDRLRTPRLMRGTP